MPTWVTELFNGMIGGGVVAGLLTFLDFRLREKWKHDLQQKLEAYKVSLIAEAEAAKAKQDFKKSIALRYAEIEFERFVELEHMVAGLSPEVLAYAAMASEHKTNEDHKLLLDKQAYRPHLPLTLPSDPHSTLSISRSFCSRATSDSAVPVNAHTRFSCKANEYELFLC